MKYYQFIYSYIIYIVLKHKLLKKIMTYVFIY